MLNISEILECILIEESVSPDKVNSAIDDKNKIIINYNSHGEDIATGWRIIEPCAYGLTKAGNPVIRAYQPNGDTASKKPAWKFFRLDRVINWKPTQEHFTEAPPDYNPNGDRSMSIVYNNAEFNDNTPDTKMPNTTEPRKKTDSIFIPPGEKNIKQGFDKLQKQLNNPVYKDEYINNKKTQDGFRGSDIKTNNEPQQSTGPKKKIEQPLINKPKNDIFNIGANKNNIFKTPGEEQAKQRFDNLKRQIDNPEYVDPSVLNDYEKNKNKRNNRNI